MPHYVVSDLGLHCLPIILLQFHGKNGLKCSLVSFHLSDIHGRGNEVIR